MRISATLKKAISFLLCLALSFCFSAPISVTVAEENVKKIPTIILDDQIWYKHNILSLEVKDGIIYIPMSVFSSLDGFTVKADDDSYIIKAPNGYISIDAQSGRYLDHNGNRGDTKLLKGDIEYYTEAEKVTGILGIGYESKVLYEQTVVRLSTGEEQSSVESIIEDYLSSSESFTSTMATLGGSAEKKVKVSVLADVTALSPEKVDELLTDFKNMGVTITFAINDSFVKKAENRPCILRMIAEGHSLAVRTSKGKISAIDQMRSVNETLALICKQKTLLSYGSFEVDKLNDSGYVVLQNTLRISNITKTGTLSDKTAEKILILSAGSADDMSKLFELSAAAKNGGKVIMAMNPLTGN